MLQPLDVVKTRLQIEDGLGSLPRYGSTLHAFRVILQSEGWRALYAGTVQWYTMFSYLNNMQITHSTDVHACGEVVLLTAFIQALHHR